MNIYSGVNLHMYLGARETSEACERYMSYAFRLAHSWSYGFSRWNRNYRLDRSKALGSKPGTQHARDLLLKHTFSNTTQRNRDKSRVYVGHDSRFAGEAKKKEQIALNDISTHHTSLSSSRRSRFEEVNGIIEGENGWKNKETFLRWTAVKAEDTFYVGRIFYGTLSNVRREFFKITVLKKKEQPASLL